MGQSRQRHWSSAWTSRGLALILAAACPAAAKAAGSEPVPAQDLQLAVSVNGVPLDLIAGFSLASDGTLRASRGELAELGIQVPGQGPSGELIALGGIPGMGVRYDAVTQSVALTLPDSLRIARRLDASAQSPATLSPSATGVVLNYSGFAQSQYAMDTSRPMFDAAAVTLDGRAYSRFGILSQSGIVTAIPSGTPGLRLDTTWSLADEQTMRMYRAGDVITGSLSWSRPVRLGGGQVQRNFGLRPDLVTMPLPSAKGSAAVPSTVDVYVNNIKTYSAAVGSGPFAIDNVPVSSGATDTRVVVTDVTGRQTEQSAAFFTAPELLRKGLIDYSLEAGVVRRSYGTASFDYALNPAVSATLRYGVSDRFTGELHGEATNGLINAGIGGFLPLSPKLGMVNGAIAASAGNSGSGLHLYAAWRGWLGPLSVLASTSRSFGHFEDLAAVNSWIEPGDDTLIEGAFPLATDQISLGYHFDDLRADIRLGAVHQQDSSGDHSYVASADITKTLGSDISLYASGFLGGVSHFGVSVGASVPLGREVQVSGSAQVVDGVLNGRVEAQRAIDERVGGYGWRVARSQGSDANYTSASAAYHGSVARVEAGAYAQAGNAAFHAQADGAVVVADGGAFLANTIADSFAVVDAGAAGVPVMLENRDIGVTNGQGKLLVPGLNAYQRSKLSLDVTQLPVDAVIPQTEMQLAPRDRTGVVADFGIRKSSSSAVVILTGADGQVLPPGTPVVLEGTQEASFVGYDGRVFLTTLRAANTISASLATAGCTAKFGYAGHDGTQQVIGPVKCQ